MNSAKHEEIRRNKSIAALIQKTTTVAAGAARRGVKNTFVSRPYHMLQRRKHPVRVYMSPLAQISQMYED